MRSDDTPKTEQSKDRKPGKVKLVPVLVCDGSPTILTLGDGTPVYIEDVGE